MRNEATCSLERALLKLGNPFVARHVDEGVVSATWTLYRSSAASWAPPLAQSTGCMLAKLLTTPTGNVGDPPSVAFLGPNQNSIEYPATAERIVVPLFDVLPSCFCIQLRALG